MKTLCGGLRRGSRAEPDHGLRSSRVGDHSVDKPANQNADRVRTRREHHSSVSHLRVLLP
jgi:hypothetical protein